MAERMMRFVSMALCCVLAGLPGGEAAVAAPPSPRPPARPEPKPIPINPLDKAGLQRGLRRLVAGAAANDGTLAIAVKELGAKEAIFVRRGDKALHPASCVKLVTAAAVLRRLGTQTRLETRLYGLVAGTTMVTPLYVWGEGDPSLTREHLTAFAAALVARGVAAMPFGIVVDDSYFDGKRWAPGFQKSTASGYSAPTGAVSVQGNAVQVEVTPAGRPGLPAEVQALPDSDYIRLNARVRTTARGLGFWAHAARLRSRPERPGQRGRPERLRVVARGRIGVGNEPRSRWVRVVNPARFFGESLRRALTDAGVMVGPVARGRLPAATDARRPPVVHAHRSEPLATLVKTMNEHSSNFYAEQLLKVLGARASGAPGTTAKGITEAKRLMSWLSIPANRYRLANGSGLGGRTKLSVRILVTLLDRTRAKPKLHQALSASLAVWGRSGTLEKRMVKSVNVGRVRAKTGTLKDVSCLAGYVDGKPGTRPLIFAILHNGFTRGLLAVRRVQRRATELMVRYAHTRTCAARR
jgi:D-alanyl-D-alanine carboxypeptidase/D-alanyl-D-alanine-endopeptidase (penicillin-binding protein 4)